jgi:hypothetical protein
MKSTNYEVARCNALHPPVTSCLFGPNLLSISQTLSVYSLAASVDFLSVLQWSKNCHQSGKMDLYTQQQICISNTCALRRMNYNKSQRTHFGNVCALQFYTYRSSLYGSVPVRL